MPSKIATKILDIRVGQTEFDIIKDLKKGLRPKDGEQKTLPTLLLYDENGLRLFEKITYLDQYYLTNAEIEVLETYRDQIADRIQSGSILVELGSGNLRKVNILLQAIERQGKEVNYYAVDLSLPELERTFSQIPTEGYKHVKCFGLYGTYDDALEWLKSPQMNDKPKNILWLGSSLGNFKRHEVPPFLTGFRNALQPGDTMLIGVDACKNPERVFDAYNDRDNVTREFTLNGLRHANRIVNETLFDSADWDAVGEYVVADGCHRACVVPLQDVEIDGVMIAKGERVRIEESHKYSRKETDILWEESGLVENTVWTTSTGDYGLHLISKPAFFFSRKPEKYAAKPVPSLGEWDQIWTAWDAVTQQMIPQDQLLAKPIKLRNACIFYLGHIPTFLDMHIARATDSPATEPSVFQRIFERGIDPDVENPEQCHVHSEIPDTWPSVHEILEFQEKVRGRVSKLYASGAAESDDRVSRALWLGFEHEAMHLETLLYMLIQSDKVNSPPGTVAPDFEALAQLSETLTAENEWIDIPSSTIVVGQDDTSKGDGSGQSYGWDNETPARSLDVKSFQAKARPITNREYAAFLAQTGKTHIPASWHKEKSSASTTNPTAKQALNGHSYHNGDRVNDLIASKYIRTVYGPVPLSFALDWPVAASYDELVACARWMGGRIPTMEEAHSIYKHAEDLKALKFHQMLGNNIPAVNAHLINNGVSETPPSIPQTNGNLGTAASPQRTNLFINLEGSNTAFHHWHPASVVNRGKELCGRADLGGLWEWTSTVLEKHEGFKPMSLYPGYTADFFDKKHNVVLGGSWATHPRLAGRKSFVNWYQRNYPYVWATARIVRDV